MSAMPSTTALPLTRDSTIDAITNGYRWTLDSSRTVNWALAGGFFGEYWSNPSATVAELQQAFSTFS